MCVGLRIAVFTICLISSISAQAPVDYHEEEADPVRASERETVQAVGETERELQHRERLRLAALEAELQEELKLAQYNSNNEDDGVGAIPGRAGQDYPVYTSVPRTSFSCAGKLLPGYYADVQARCQVFHICDAAGGKHSFLCPHGSLFNQKYLVCDWWYTSECDPADEHGYQHDFNRLGPSKETVDILPENQYFSDVGENYILLQPDIFHSAETGVPNREKYESAKQISKSSSEMDKTKGVDKKDKSTSIT